MVTKLSYPPPQVRDSRVPPILLQGHSKEVTAVDWCPTNIDKVRRHALTLTLGAFLEPFAKDKTILTFYCDLLKLGLF